MKKLVLILCNAIALLGAPFVSANETVDASKEAAINRLFDAMDFEKTMSQSMNLMKASMPQQMMGAARSTIESSRLSEDQKREAIAKIEAEMPSLSNTLMNQFLGKEFLDDVQKNAIQLYARHFTTEEIDQLADFYRSPVGRKTMAKIPVIMQESMQFTMQQMQRRAPLIQEEVTKRFKPSAAQ
ncbi:MAG: DUF2059 domain-containing protein [Burkholderiales bacterium]|nr:DUF2059 domain-containing protein [Burkholderiales bacterium]